jgi:menaquinol-cytochrome c reductase iron-sulfur subunit
MSLPADRTPRRRTFLALCTGALMTLVGGLIAAPAMGYLLAPFWRKRTAENADEYVDIGPVTGLTLQRWVLLPLEIVQEDGWERVRQRHSVWVKRFGTGDADIRVLSPICPHLGCPINYMSDKSEFQCPCHGGTFDGDGHHVSGPPPRAMDPLPFKVEDGRLLVRWEDYLIGVSDRVVVRV